MPHCVECGAVTQSLYTEYSRGNIRLTQCSRCGKFADKYVENDFVIAFLDLILHRPQVYRHLLLNVLDREHAFTTEIGKLAVLQALFDVYVKLLKYEEAIDATAAANAIIPNTSFGWASIVPSTCHFGYVDGASVTGCVEQIGQIFHGLLATERSIAQSEPAALMAIMSTERPFILSYFYVLLISITESILFIFCTYLCMAIVTFIIDTFRTLSATNSSNIAGKKSTQNTTQSPRIDSELDDAYNADHDEIWRPPSRDPSLRQMAAAMILSSFGLLLVILMVIWKMQKNPHRMLLDLFVFTSRGQALAVIYGRRYQVCFVALLSAMMMRTFMLKAVVSFAMNLF